MQGFDVSLQAFRESPLDFLRFLHQIRLEFLRNFAFLDLIFLIISRFGVAEFVEGWRLRTSNRRVEFFAVLKETLLGERARDETLVGNEVGEVLVKGNGRRGTVALQEFLQIHWVFTIFYI